MMNRKRDTAKFNLDLYSIDQAIFKLREIKKTLTDQGWTDLSIRMTDSESFYIQGFRPEIDEEKEFRRHYYLTLKKEFENDEE